MPLAGPAEMNGGADANPDVVAAELARFGFWGAGENVLASRATGPLGCPKVAECPPKTGGCAIVAFDTSLGWKPGNTGALAPFETGCWSLVVSAMKVGCATAGEGFWSELAAVICAPKGEPKPFEVSAMSPTRLPRPKTPTSSFPKPVVDGGMPILGALPAVVFVARYPWARGLVLHTPSALLR